jgi:hypothetical protein
MEFDIVRKNEKKAKIYFYIFIFFLLVKEADAVQAEPARVLIDGALTVTKDNPAGSAITLSYTSSALISLENDMRFLRGVELTLTAPQLYLAYRGSLAVVLYANIGKLSLGVADIDARLLLSEPLPNKIQSVYQVPIRDSHGLRTTPYVTVPNGVVPPSSFPLLFRMMPVVKGLSEDVEKMSFTLHAKPILSNEGALSLSFRYPEQLRGKPFALLIDDILIENVNEERLLREGEHHLLILSENFRAENRTFLIERGKTLELAIELHDPTPLVFFEAPEKTEIYFDNELVSGEKSLAVEPGKHEVRFQLSDYSIIRSITIQKGKTYKISLNVEMSISENE